MSALAASAWLLFEIVFLVGSGTIPHRVVAEVSEANRGSVRLPVFILISERDVDLNSAANLHKAVELVFRYDGRPPAGDVITDILSNGPLGAFFTIVNALKCGSANLHVDFCRNERCDSFSRIPKRDGPRDFALSGWCPYYGRIESRLAGHFLVDSDDRTINCTGFFKLTLDSTRCFACEFRNSCASPTNRPVLAASSRMALAKFSVAVLNFCVSVSCAP